MISDIYKHEQKSRDDSWPDRFCICVVCVSQVLHCWISTVITLFLSPLGNDRNGRGKRLIGICTIGYPVFLSIKAHLCWDNPLMNICVDTDIFKCSETSSLLLPSFLIISFEVLTIQPGRWSQPMKQYKLVSLTISPFKQKVLAILSIGRISLHHLDVPERGWRAAALRSWVVPAYHAELSE